MNKPDLIHFGGRLKDFRESMHMTQSEFVDAQVVPFLKLDLLQAWEQGRRTPPEYVPALLWAWLLQRPVESPLAKRKRVIRDR